MINGTKVKVTDSYYEHHVLKAKKGSNAVYITKETKTVYENGLPVKKEMVKIQLNNGNFTVVPFDHIKEYEPDVREKLEELSNEDLVSRFEIMSIRETQMKTRSKIHQKTMKDLDRMRKEILKRMNQ